MLNLIYIIFIIHYIILMVLNLLIILISLFLNLIFQLFILCLLFLPIYLPIMVVIIIIYYYNFLNQVIYIFFSSFKIPLFYSLNNQQALTLYIFWNFINYIKWKVKLILKYHFLLHTINWIIFNYHYWGKRKEKHIQKIPLKLKYIMFQMILLWELNV